MGRIILTLQIALLLMGLELCIVYIRTVMVYAQRGRHSQSF